MTSFININVYSDVINNTETIQVINHDKIIQKPVLHTKNVTQINKRINIESSVFYVRKNLKVQLQPEFFSVN